MDRVEELYREYVVAHQLERTGLFEALLERYGPPATVLYPGCFVHLTPSFYFQHVVYVDKNPLARDFFAHDPGLQRLISARKQYSRKTYVQFIEQDYTQPLPVTESSFDLLLALYAGGISRSCKRYLKPGGLLLTNDHVGNAAEAEAEKDLELIATVTVLREHYTFSDEGLETFFVPKKPGQTRSRSATGRLEFSRTANYYVFRRVRSS